MAFKTNGAEGRNEGDNLCVRVCARVGGRTVVIKENLVFRLRNAGFQDMETARVMSCAFKLSSYNYKTVFWKQPIEQLTDFRQG